MTNLVSIPYGCTVQREIRNLWPLMQTRTRFKVVNGQKVSFWNGKWIGNAPLNSMYPDLFSLCQTQHTTVAEMRTEQAQKLQFRRHLNDCFFPCNSARFHQSSGRRGQNGMAEGQYRKILNKIACKELNASEFQKKDWPWKMISKAKVPYKVNCFTWLIAKDAVVTQKNLNKGDFRCVSVASYANNSQGQSTIFFTL